MLPSPSNCRCVPNGAPRSYQEITKPLCFLLIIVGAAGREHDRHQQFPTVGKPENRFPLRTEFFQGPQDRPGPRFLPVREPPFRMIWEVPFHPSSPIPLPKG